MAFTIPNELDAFNGNQAEVDSKDFDILLGGSAKNGVVSGCAVTQQGTPNMTVQVSSGVVVVGGVVKDVSSVASLALGAADATNPRFDLISVSNAGVVSVVAGTAAGEPVFPAIPANSIILAAIYVPAAETAIVTNRITDKRVLISLADLDRGGQVFNVKAYGAVGDGSADDTAAISAALTAAMAVKGTLFFPAGTFKTTGDYDLSNQAGLTIRGEGSGSIIRLAHATNTLFRWGSGNVNDLSIGNFKVVSDTVTRTAGWVINGTAAYNAANGTMFYSRIHDILMANQVNGISITRYVFVTVENCDFIDGVGSGTAFRAGQTAATAVNQGSELYFINCQVFGTNAAPSIGFLIEDCDAVYLRGSGATGTVDHSLKMIAGGWGLNNHFFHNWVSDTTKNNHSTYITGTGVAHRLMFAGCWFASAGQGTGGVATANGVRIDATTLGTIQFTGCHFVNNKGTGLYITKSGRITVSGCAFESNGLGATANNNYGMYFNASAAGGTAPVITGCNEEASNGTGLRLGANADKATVVGNRWNSGVTYDVKPQVSALNVGAGDSFVTEGDFGIGTTTPNRNGFGADDRVLTIEAVVGAKAARQEFVGKDVGAGVVGGQSYVHNDAGNFRELGYINLKTDGAADAGKLEFGTVGSGSAYKVPLTMYANGTSRFTGRLATARVALTLVNGDNNDVALPATSFPKIAGPTGAFAITGIAAGGDGDVLRIFNPLAQTMTIKNENAGSAAANRITTLTGADIVLRAAAPSFVTLIYDTGSSRWIVTSTN